MKGFNIKLFILSTIFIISGCSTTVSNIKLSPTGNNLNNKATYNSNKKPNELEDIYFLQHRLLPQFTFQTRGAFFSDLIKEDLTKLRIAASEIVSSDYAMGITTKYYPTHDGALLIFPTPQEITHCYYVFIQRVDNNYSYYTYEKSPPFHDNDPTIGIVGSWTQNKSHSNSGTRTYTTADDFIDDLMNQ